MLGEGDRLKNAGYDMTGRCKRCGQWTLKDGDNYCGYCGVLNLPLSVSESRFRLVSGVLNVFPLTIRNDSAEAVKVVFHPRTSGCELVRVLPSSELEIPAQGTSQVNLELDLDSIPDGFVRENAVFHIVVADNERMSLAIAVEILAGPKLRAEPNKILFPFLVQGSQATREVKLFNAGQLPLTISSVRLEGGSWLSIEMQEPVPVVILPGKSLPVKIIFEATAQASENTAPALLRVLAEGLPEEQTLIEAYVRRVGLEASPKEVLKDPCLSRHRHSARISLRNVGAEDISVVGISSSDPSWVEVVSPDTIFTLGADIPNGGQGFRAPSQASFDLFLRTEGLEAGWHESTVSVLTNSEDVRLDIPVRVRIVTPSDKPHPEYVGIDFGTTASVVSFLDTVTMTPRVIEVNDPTGGLSPLIPSVLVMTRRDTVNGRDNFVIGHEAKSLAGARPNETVRSIKRVLGYGNDRTIMGKEFTPEALAARIIRSLADLAEYEIYKRNTALRGQLLNYAPVTKAMVTVPANFYDLQIRGVLEACRMANLDTEEERTRAEAKAKTEAGTGTAAGVIIDEPSAAAIHFLASLSESGDALKVIEEKGEGVFLIYDHGGGTLDVSVVSIRKEDHDLHVRVLASKGNNRVGGDSIDLAIMREMVERCGERHPQLDKELIRSNYKHIETLADQEQWDAEAKASVFRARYAWKDAAEGVKIRLSSETESKFFVDHLSIGCIRGRSYISEDEPFESLLKEGDMKDFVGGLLTECRNLVKGAMELAGIQVDRVDYVVHTGRTSYMPLIQETIKSIFPMLQPERFILDPDNLKVCVAKGAAFYGAMRVALTDTRIRLMDAGHRLPHSYGVLRHTGFVLAPQFDEIIPLGTECPASKERHYDTDGPTLQIRFYQNSGKNKSIRNNPEVKPLGQVVMDTRREDGSLGCDVRFVVDANRILEVYANDSLVPLQPQRLEEDERWIG